MKTKRNFLITLFLFVVILSQAQIKLSFNPVKDSRYAYLYRTEQTTLIEVQDRTIKMGMNMYVDYDMFIKEKSKEGFVLEAEYTDLGISILSDMINLQYDSKKPEADTTRQSRLLGDVLSSMLHKPFTVHFLNDGSVKSVSGMDAIMEGVDQAAAANPELVSAFKESFSEASMKNIFEQTFKIYPSSPVRVGDNWNVDIELPFLGLDVTMTNNYTLLSVEKKIAKIDVTSNYRLTSADGISTDMSGILNGEMNLDVKTGMPVAARLNQQIKGTQKVEGTDIRMSTDSEVTFSLQEK